MDIFINLKVLLQNKNNIDRRIWITLPTYESEIKEAIDDIRAFPDDEYIICDYKVETDFKISIAADDDVFNLNDELHKLYEKLED